MFNRKIMVSYLIFCVRFDAHGLFMKSLQVKETLMATSENPGPCVTLPRQNAHLPFVNSAFVSVASLDSEVFGGCLINHLCWIKRKAHEARKPGHINRILMKYPD